jgi:hypothetical protein
MNPTQDQGGTRQVKVRRAGRDLDGTAFGTRQTRRGNQTLVLIEGRFAWIRSERIDTQPDLPPNGPTDLTVL